MVPCIYCFFKIPWWLTIACRLRCVNLYGVVMWDIFCDLSLPISNLFPCQFYLQPYWVKFPSVCCGPLYVCVCFSFLLLVQVFPYLFFLPNWWPHPWRVGSSVNHLMKASVAHTAKHNRLFFICTTTVPYACDAIIPLRYIARIICLLYNYLIFWIVYTCTLFKFQ